MPTQNYPQAAKLARIAYLSEQLMHHRYLYDLGRPTISDSAYDALEGELRTLAPDHPALSLIGPEPTAQSVKVSHQEPMLSLNKTYDVEELVKWADSHQTVGMLKIDGVSLALVYQSGALKVAKTRGNGQVGEDVTLKVRWIPSVPSDLAKNGEDCDGTVEIRGEICCSQSQFMRLAQHMQELGLEKPTSPRNIVAGFLGRKTHYELCRYFTFYAFGAYRRDRDVSQDFASEWDQFKWLTSKGFMVPEPAVIKSREDLEGYLARVRDVMDEDEVPIDGAVFSYLDRALHHKLGNTAHHPRAKLSFKWQGQTATATVQRVEWATSRLGVVTPVAVIEPVFLSGATITNVTLHNAAYVKNYNIKPGDVIEVVRSGEVIPKFLRILEESPGNSVLPEVCPSCGGPLESDEIRLRCHNTLHCPAQRLGIILNWINAVDIEDLSEKRLCSMIEQGMVKSPADLYHLTVEDLLTLPQTKAKLAGKLFENIQKTKSLPLARFLNGLGIEGMGLTTWEKLLDSQLDPSLEALQHLNVSDVAKIHGFAQKSAQDLVGGLAERRELIQSLLEAGVTFTARKPAKVSAKSGLAGKIFVITGALSRPREAIAEIIKDMGGKVAGSVSQKTFAVVTNDTETTSSKMIKARELGISVLNEAELNSLIESVQK